MKLPQVAVPSLPYRGHPHFARRLLNRRRFLEKTGLTVGALAASGLLTGAASAASTANRGRHSTTTAAPQPIPGGLQLLGPDGPLFQSTFRDPRIEIVNLHVLHGTCEYIKSYERERAMMV